MDPYLINWASGVIVLGGAAGVFWAVFRPIIKKFKLFIASINDFMRDWAGTPAEPGRDAVPGVMERLKKLDGQLTNNGGASMKDAVDRIEADIKEIKVRLDEGTRRFEHIEEIIHD